MKQKLSNYIFSAFLMNVFAIVSVGCLSVFMVRAMVTNISELEVESGYISKIYAMNNQIQENIFLVQNSLIELDLDLLEHAIRTTEEVRQSFDFYQEEEMVKDITDIEIPPLVVKIDNHLSSISKLLQQAAVQLKTEQDVNRADLKKIESFGYHIQNLMEAVNSVHIKRIRDLVEDSNTKVYYILFLCLTSSLVGIMASGVAYLVLARNTIRPIIDLASATEKVALGDLGVRVKTGSRTEIGRLYSTFNEMTEKLQEQTREQDTFNFELERMVEERTSELRDSEESLRKTQVDLLRVQKIATIGHIATSVNHEVKTPLNVLSMNLQLLNKKIKKCTIEEEEQKDTMLDTIKVIDNEVSRINEIVEEFVTYARFPSPDFKETNVNQLVEDIAEMVQQTAKKAQVTIDVTTDSKPLLVSVDEKKLIQALLNLCMNGIQAMLKGGTLSICSLKKGDNLLISVADTGVGIAAVDLGKIFEPFFTKKEKGTGFGLAIVQRIVEDHGGRITCRSEMNSKTIFEILIPLNIKDRLIS